MDKLKIREGMKMVRQESDNRYLKRSEYNTDTGVAGSGLNIVVGTTQPTDTKTIWINTTNYWGV